MRVIARGPNNEQEGVTMTTPGNEMPQREPKRFDGAELARSVIAGPLLDQIQHEVKITDDVLIKYPWILHNHNAAVFLNPEFPGGPGAALDAVRKMLPDADREASAPTPSSVDDPYVQNGAQVALALLESAVIRELLGSNARKGSPIAYIWPTLFDLIIDINLNFKPPETATGDLDDHNPIASRPAPPSGDDFPEFKHPDPRRAAKARIKKYIEKAIQAFNVNDPNVGVFKYKTELSSQYVFARLEGRMVIKLVEIDRQEAQVMARAAKASQRETAKQASGSVGEVSQGVLDAIVDPDTLQFRTIHHIWPDFELASCIVQSIRTVKADAAQNSFTAFGEGITWAVMDTGIDVSHPHFELHKNIDAASPYHQDFTDPTGPGNPLKDEYGHGTHVAGIIAGEQSAEKTADPTKPSDPAKRMAVWQERGASDDPANKKTVIRKVELKSIAGMAPKCKLVSLKVLNKFGSGSASNVIAAISHVQLLNGHGRDLKIHGVNLSLGHRFDPKWFACGHSPLCVEVNRLVKSGVVVVVAAGNTGYGTLQTKEGATDTCLDLTINDPGNAECAITVGSTHRDSPHKYGVSYFSSKGPTGDGRYKPDLVAPGEKIISCAAANSTLVKDATDGQECAYFESSGTSMAAPHVSGAIAAFLSIRTEYIGEAEKVKQIFTSTATDLGRDRYFQGSGLVDLMRAIQSV